MADETEELREKVLAALLRNERLEGRPSSGRSSGAR
jgi:hypothetical protein